MSSAEHSDSPAASSQAKSLASERDLIAQPRSAALPIGAVLVAGALTWLLVHAFHPVFWSTQGMDDVGFLPVAVQWRLDSANASLVLAVWGGLIAIALALVQPATPDSLKGRLALAAKAGGMGALWGALAGFLGHLVFEYSKRLPEVSDLAKAISFNGVMLGILGAGVGLTGGLLFGPVRRSAAEGLARGALAGVLTSLIHLFALAVFVPAAMTSVLLPLEAVDRLLWFGLFSVLFGTLVAIPVRPGAQTSAAE
jgi:hypothetical protein